MDTEKIHRKLVPLPKQVELKNENCKLTEFKSCFSTFDDVNLDRITDEFGLEKVNMPSADIVWNGLSWIFPLPEKMSGIRPTY